MPKAASSSNESHYGRKPEGHASINPPLVATIISFGLSECDQQATPQSEKRRHPQRTGFPLDPFEVSVLARAGRLASFSPPMELGPANFAGAFSLSAKESSFISCVMGGSGRTPKSEGEIAMKPIAKKSGIAIATAVATLNFYCRRSGGCRSR